MADQNLKHLQEVLLMMIKEIDSLCKKHDITYYLNGGNALGAIRHNGFIPWDDDFDIMLKIEDYHRLLEVCRKELDPNIWYIQEGWKDWPGCFSKIRLKNTYLHEQGEWCGTSVENRGIFIDIFPIVHSSKHLIPRIIQYSAAKLLVSSSLRKKGDYISNTLLKRFLIRTSKILDINLFNKICKHLVFRYGADKEWLGHFFSSSRFKKAFHHKSVFQNPIYHKYENLELPLPTDYNKYLTQAYGDYMTLPPKEKQQPSHSLKVDFGKY